MTRTHTITNARTFDADGNQVVNYRQLFVEIIETVATSTGVEQHMLTSGTFDSKADAYDFIDRWSARGKRCKITLDPMSAGAAQLGLAYSRTERK